jgi:hypothetical protein
LHGYVFQAQPSFFRTAGRVVTVVLPSLDIPVATIDIVVPPPLQVVRDVLVKASQCLSAVPVIFHVEGHRALKHLYPSPSSNSVGEVAVHMPESGDVVRLRVLGVVWIRDQVRLAVESRRLARKAGRL